MKYLIVSHATTDNSVHTIYESSDDLKTARNKCEKWAAAYPGSKFSIYSWESGYESKLQIRTDRIWSVPESASAPLPFVTDALAKE